MLRWPTLLPFTPRDYLLFAFLLEQGFLTLEAVYLAFFDSRKSPQAPFPRHLEVTRQRLRLLEKRGFVSLWPVPMESKGIYLLARKGYQVLAQKLPERAFAPPPRVVDLGTFEHDIRLRNRRTKNHLPKKGNKKVTGKGRGSLFIAEKVF